MKLPQTPEGWAEADQYMRTNIVPSVLMEVDVDAMNQALYHGIHSFFTSRYGTIQPNQRHQHLPKVRNQQKILKQVLMEKNDVKKRLRRLRRNGDNPEEVWLLACEFHT